MTDSQMCPKCREKQEKVERAVCKGELLAHYANKEPHLFQQWDGNFDFDMFADGDGDSLTCGTTWELREGMDVRIQILDGTKKADAVRILKKLLLAIDTGKFGLVERATPTAKERQNSLCEAKDALQTAKNAIDENKIFSSMASAQACEQLLKTTLDVVAREMGSVNVPH